MQANGRPIVHKAYFSTAKDHDRVHMSKLFHGKEKAIFGDSGYIHKQEKVGARYEGLYYGISSRGARNSPLSTAQKKRNQRHSKIRAKVEHPFRVIKEQFFQTKLRYKGLKKNGARFTILCALSNLFVCRKDLMQTG